MNRKQRRSAARTSASRTTVPRSVKSVGRSAPSKSGPTRQIFWPVLVRSEDAQALALQFQFQQTELWDSQKIIDHQLLQAQHLIRDAVRNVAFHKNRLSKVRNILPGSLTMEKFRELPVMRRTDIQEAGERLITNALPTGHGRMFPVRSTGSTGRPIEVRTTEMAGCFIRAVTMRGHLWHKRDLDCKNVDIRTAYEKGTEPKQSRWAPMSDTGPSVRIDIALSIAEILDKLVAEDPEYLQSHPYTILGLVERSKEIGAKPGKLRQVRTFGEALEPEVRRIIEDAWGVPVIENYSAMEIGTIAHQCPETANLHVQAECVIVEVLDDDGNQCVAGETGRVVLTALHNFATPLIRYEIGDYATVGEPCSCGRGLPVLKRVLGRERNLLVLPTGEKRFPETRVGGFEKIAPIRQFQVIQKTLHDIEIRLVMPRPLTEEEELRLRDHLVERYRYSFNLNIRYMDEIPRGQNGKFAEFMSELPSQTAISSQRSESDSD